MKNLKFILLSACVVTFIVTLSWVSDSNSTSLVKPHLEDSIDTHNMLVVGEKAIFLYHLPMFQEKNAPIMHHRYQAILEVSFEKNGSNPANDYKRDRQCNPNTKIYTINPDPFVLPTLVSFGHQSGSHHNPLQNFKGNIFRGHLEKLQEGEDKILSGIEVNVKRVVYFQEFDNLAKRPDQLEYLLFGKGQELFLAHLITAPPDFDQVLSVTITGSTMNNEELAKGIKVVIPGSKNSPSTRLKEKQQAEGVINTGNTSSSQKIQLKINKEFYFEEGELKVPAKFERTPEEKKAGFL